MRFSACRFPYVLEIMRAKLQFDLSLLIRSAVSRRMASRRLTSSGRLGSNARSAAEITSDWVLPVSSAATCNSWWVSTVTLMLVVVTLPVSSFFFLGITTPNINPFVLAGNTIALLLRNSNRKFTHFYLCIIRYAVILVITARTARTLASIKSTDRVLFFQCNTLSAHRN